MNIREAARMMRYYITADIAVALWGAPGIGKTEVVHQTARDDMDDCVAHVEALNLYESVDLRGLPVNVAGAVVWSVPEMFQRLRALAEAHKTVILFLDEWNTAAPSVMVCAAQLVHTRRVGPHDLPGNVRIVCAGNRQSDRASANRTPSMLNNRLAHIDVEADARIWREDWANVPVNACHPAINAFIGFRPQMLHVMKDKDARAFASPRSWAQVSKVIKSAPQEAWGALVRGLVGEAAAGDFMAFVTSWSRVPKLSDILADPANYPVPGIDEPSLIYATAAMLSHSATRANFGGIITYLERMPQDFAVSAVIEATKRDKTLTSVSAFVDWAVRNQDVAL